MPDKEDRKSESSARDQTCSVELDEWLKGRKSKTKDPTRNRFDFRRNPKRFRGVQEDA